METLLPTLPMNLSESVSNMELALIPEHSLVSLKPQQSQKSEISEALAYGVIELPADASLIKDIDIGVIPLPH